MPNKLYSQLQASFPAPTDLLSFEDLTDNEVKSFTYQDLIDAIGGGSGGGVYTVDNGLLENIPFNFQLGGSTAPGAPLIHETHINHDNFLFQLNDSGDPTFIVDPANGVYLLGKNISAGAYLSLNSSAETATMVAKNANYIAVENSKFTAVLGGGFAYLYLDASSQIYQIGDISAFGGDNNTYLSIEDGAAQFKFNSLGATRLTILATGQLKAHQYGVGTFLDTPIYLLGVLADGTEIEVDPGSMGGGSGGSVYTVDNGLTENTSGNFQLGGTLLHDSTIDADTFTLFVTGTDSTEVLRVDNTGSGSAIHGTAASGGLGVFGESLGGTGVYGQTNDSFGVYGAATTTGFGVYAVAQSGYGLFAQSASGVAGGFKTDNPSVDTVVTLLDVHRNSSGTTDDGAGGSIDFNITAANGSKRTANQLISKWTDATDATRTSQFIITGVDSGTTGDLIIIDGDGTITIPNLAGTGTRNVVVDASGVLSAP